MVELKVVNIAPNGVVIWEGNSLLDGCPIVVIAVGLVGSSNEKTGSMLQTYILRADVPPLEALASGADRSVCEDCVHRKVGGVGSCYVNVGQAPAQVWRTYSENRYAHKAASGLGAGRLVRLGSYGDPVAVPVEVWAGLLEGSLGHSGYTHQWRRPWAKSYRRMLMASADSPASKRKASRAGWRTFRVRSAGESLLPGEIVCPASEEAGKHKTCSECLACDGSGGAKDRRASVTIVAHGLDYKVRRFAARTS